MKSRKDFETEAEYKEYLRTHFAMAAMQGLCANSNIPTESIPAGAIGIADETLKQLENS